MLGYKGFMHCHPSAANDCQIVAREQCLKKTGLVGNFTALGGGYVRVYQGDKLESFTHFTLLYCDDAQGELAQNDNHAEYFWELDPDFTSKEMFPTTPLLKQLYDGKQPFFVDKTFTI